MKFPTIGYYYTNPNGRPNPNTTLIEIGEITLWFSYLTAVAFQVGGQPRVISHNYWGSQTGKHLNAIDPDKSKRVKRDEFEARLRILTDRVNEMVDNLCKFGKINP